jgi:hypothetical protein
MPSPLPPVKCGCYRMHPDDNRRQLMPGAERRQDRGLLAASRDRNFRSRTRNCRVALPRAAIHAMEGGHSDKLSAVARTSEAPQGTPGTAA